MRMQKSDLIDIIDKFYPSGTKSRELLISHSNSVAEKALRVARKVSHLAPDLAFIEEAALLHDIGVFYTNAPAIGCYGDYPYVCHGYLGRRLLTEMGLPRHGLVCERHVGAGLSREEIEIHALPIPPRDMVPVSIEEQIICYADKFFSKNMKTPDLALPLDAVVRKIESYGPVQAARFQNWVAMFESN